MNEGRRSSFGWNVGGWFGTQLGCSVWMLVTAGVLLGRHLGAAVACFVCFLVPNLVGTGLWIWRAKVSAYAAIQTLILAAGFASIITVAVAERVGEWDRLGVGGNLPAPFMYVLIGALVSGLVGLAWAKERKFRARHGYLEAESWVLILSVPLMRQWAVAASCPVWLGTSTRMSSKR